MREYKIGDVVGDFKIVDIQPEYGYKLLWNDVPPIAGFDARWYSDLNDFAISYYGNISDINSLTPKIGDVIRLYGNFYKVVFEDRLLKGVPLFNSDYILYLLNHSGEFEIIN